MAAYSLIIVSYGSQGERSRRALSPGGTRRLERLVSRSAAKAREARIDATVYAL